MARKLDRSIRPGFGDDVRALPSANLQRLAIQILIDVSTCELAGVPLDERVSTGDLSDCRKVYFDERDGKPRFRLVYRLLPNEIEAVIVEGVAGGYRERLRVYVAAAQRLGRFPQT